MPFYYPQYPYSSTPQPPPEIPKEQSSPKEESSTEEKKKKEKSKKLEVFGNPETMNLPEMVLLNIQASEYFKSLLYVYLNFFSGW
jgi:hypothetical protein